MSKDLDEVNSKRYKINYDGDNIYVVISHEAKEVFISSVNDQNHKIGAIYDSLTRMISMAWQNNDTESILKQLQKASRTKWDLPGMLADLLNQD